VGCQAGESTAHQAVGVCGVERGVGARQHRHCFTKKALPTPENAMHPVHPGEVLREDYLTPLGMSANALSIALKVPASRINDIVLERRGIKVDTAMRIVRYFGGDVQSWMNLQTAYEIKVTEKLLTKKVFADVQPMAA